MNLNANLTSAEPAVSPTDRRALWVSLGLALITGLIYLPAGRHDFILMDDPIYVTHNAMVTGGLSWAGLKWAFLGWHASNWHPLTWVSHQLDCELFGLNPVGHHLVNVLLHAANSVLLFHLWRRLTGALWPSAMVAALFAWHPLHVESVAWVAERKDVLSTFFGLLAMLAYVRYAQESQAQSPGSKVGYILSLLAFALGLLAKPMLVTLPFVLLLLDVWPLGRFPADGRWLGQGLRLAVEKGPFFLLTGLSCLCTFLAQRTEAVVSLQKFALGLRLENAVVSAAAYLGQTFWPVNLSAYYQLPERIAPGAVAVALTVLLAVSGLVWRGRRNYPCLIFGWLWFLGMLVPVIGLVQVGGQSRADRYMYLPAVGLFVAVVFGLTIALRHWRHSPRLAGLAAAAVLAACAAITVHQLAFWQNTETLFLHTLAVEPNNDQAHMILANVYHEQGRLPEARIHYDAAMADYARILVPVAGGGKRPLAAQMQFEFGQEARQKGELEDAATDYQEALRLDPNYVEAHNELGALLAGAGRSAAALEQYSAVLRLQPGSPQAHENAGNELLKLGRLDDAFSEFQAATNLAPADAQPVCLMGKVLLRQGQNAAAAAAFENALRLNVNDSTNLVYLACVLASDPSAALSNGPRAVELSERANQLTGGSRPYVLATLAMAYAETGRFADARQTVQAALNLAATNRPEMMASLLAQQKLYETGQPCRTVN